MTQADELLSEAYRDLGLASAGPHQKYDRVDDIVKWLEKRNADDTINVKTTGTISERICRLALESYVGLNYFEHLPKEWKWLADFSILGRPLNVLVSVKSFTAKERLLMSGSGVLLAPTIGFGLFNEEDEWNESRLRSYALRGFVSIYMPKALHTTLKTSKPELARFRNLNSKRFLRPLGDFGKDLKSASENGRLNPTKL